MRSNDGAPNPGDILTLPPACRDALVSPADRVREPPAPVDPDPTVTEIAPALPVVATPELMEIDPELPVVAAPEPMEIAPELPVPVVPDSMYNDPLFPAVA